MIPSPSQLCLCASEDTKESEVVSKLLLKRKTTRQACPPLSCISPRGVASLTWHSINFELCGSGTERWCWSEMQRTVFQLVCSVRKCKMHKTSWVSQINLSSTSEKATRACTHRTFGQLHITSKSPAVLLRCVIASQKPEGGDQKRK